jgi:DNA-binding TFAR19-related protein (PDSD5 family)
MVRVAMMRARRMCASIDQILIPSINQVTEERLIQMLEQVSSQVDKRATKVTIQRRRYMEDDDDDNDDDLL